MPLSWCQQPHSYFLEAPLIPILPVATFYTCLLLSATPWLPFKGNLYTYPPSGTLSYLPRLMPSSHQHLSPHLLYYQFPYQYFDILCIQFISCSQIYPIINKPDLISFQFWQMCHALNISYSYHM